MFKSINKYVLKIRKKIIGDRTMYTDNRYYVSKNIFSSKNPFEL